jgi:non-ribosomal peptide synthase protein (TIGR01720 family)
MRQTSIRAQSRIDIADGRLVSAVLFKTQGSRPDQLLLLVHHLVVDSVSMRIIIQDLETVYRILKSGEEAVLPEKTVSVRTWQESIAEYATSPSVLNQLDYWRAAPRADFALADLGDRPVAVAPENTVSRAGNVHVTVPERIVSELINHGYRIARASLRDILLTGFLLAWQEQTGRSGVQLDLEGHGREPLGRSVNVTRTVGWFTAIYPASLLIPETTDKLDILRAVHEQLQRIPERGIGYGILRYLSGPSGAELAQLARSQVSFNYLGWLKQPNDEYLFGPPMHGPWLLQHGEAPRQYLLEVIISGTQGQIDTDFAYAGDFYLDRDLRKLANRYVNILEEISFSLAACAE